MIDDKFSSPNLQPNLYLYKEGTDFEKMGQHRISANIEEPGVYYLLVSTFERTIGGADSYPKKTYEMYLRCQEPSGMGCSAEISPRVHEPTAFSHLNQQTSSKIAQNNPEKQEAIEESYVVASAQSHDTFESHPELYAEFQGYNVTGKEFASIKKITDEIARLNVANIPEADSSKLDFKTLGVGCRTEDNMRDPNAPGHVRCVWHEPSNSFVEILNKNGLQGIYSDAKDTLGVQKIDEVGLYKYRDDSNGENTNFVVLTFEDSNKVLTFKHHWKTGNTDSTGGQLTTDQISRVSPSPFMSNIRLLAKINRHQSARVAQQNSAYYEGNAEYPLRLVQMAAYRVANVENYSTEQISRTLAPVMSEVLDDTPDRNEEYRQQGLRDLLSHLGTFGNGADLVSPWGNGVEELGRASDGSDVKDVGNISYTKTIDGAGESGVMTNLYVVRYEGTNIVTAAVIYQMVG